MRVCGTFTSSALLGTFAGHIRAPRIPPVQTQLADIIGIQSSFIVPMIAFAYVAFHGIYDYRAGRSTTAEEAATGLPVTAGSIEAA